MTDTSAPNSPTAEHVRLHGWRHPAILATAALAVWAGFAQFGATTALADVARVFGEPTAGDTLAEQAGLSGTTVGLGLAVIRLASLASMPLAGLADRQGRRRVALSCVALGLALTALAALSPTFWWFVALFAAGRPLLSATNALAGVLAAEQTRTADRAKAIALVTAAYGTGAGLTAVVRGAAGGELGFRGLFALSAIPLVLLPLVGRFVREPDRYQRLRGADLPLGGEAAAPGATLRLGHVGAALRGRLWLMTGLTFALGFVAGPANTFLFLYAEGVLGMSRDATALMVVSAAPVGLAGLLAGRWSADRFGRRVTGGLAQVLVAGGAILAYSGSPAALLAGYLAGTVLGGAAYAPATVALAAELFPTSTRATVAGWLTAAGVLGATTGLLAFGVLADLLASIGAAALLVASPVAAASVLFAYLPETRGQDLDEPQTSR